jgi:hypothetical protein
MLSSTFSSRLGLTGRFSAGASAGSITSTGVRGTSCSIPCCATRARRAFRMSRCTRTSRSFFSKGRIFSRETSISVDRAALSSVSSASKRALATS